MGNKKNLDGHAARVTSVEMGLQEAHKTEWNYAQTPEPEEYQCKAPGHAKGNTVGKQLSRKGPSSRHQVKDEWPICPLCKGQQYPQLLEEDLASRSKAVIPLLSNAEATPGVPCLGLGSLLQKRHGHTGETPVEGHRADDGPGKSMLCLKTKVWGTSINVWRESAKKKASNSYIDAQWPDKKPWEQNEAQNVL